MNGPGAEGRVRPVAVVIVTTLLMLGFSAFTRLSWTPPDAERALLRLSWRTTVSAREQCRERTPGELDALPVHMRTPEVCEPDDASYVLILRVGGAPPDTMQLLRGGVKGDRPLFVLDDHVLSPGRHRVAVELLRLNGPAPEPLAVPLDTIIDFQAGSVRLITLDPEGRALIVRG